MNLVIDRTNSGRITRTASLPHELYRNDTFIRKTILGKGYIPLSMRGKKLKRPDYGPIRHLRQMRNILLCYSKLICRNVFWREGRELTLTPKNYSHSHLIFCLSTAYFKSESSESKSHQLLFKGALIYK